ncbi:hypothetical protein MIND_01139500 [Mycena indigotica]|uniref:Uncharacterized protein n=1 Tax=Mycena indigotica TaxID=2126181 RepID=A0A8H6S798_9AGAR|nr:uncharacterized protein MIND_01139500 [Mycena indigotica]KAF7293603.1 hypothetical protein MIND_01139500 [Mycena indigotica]
MKMQPYLNSITRTSSTTTDVSGAGDIEGAVGDMSRLTSLLAESQTQELHFPTRLLPPSSLLPCCDQHAKTMLALRPRITAVYASAPTVQDPRAWFCPARRSNESNAGDWRGASATLKGTGKKGDIYRKFQEAATEQLAAQHLTLFTLSDNATTSRLSFEKRLDTADPYLVPSSSSFLFISAPPQSSCGTLLSWKLTSALETEYQDHLLLSWETLLGWNEPLWHDGDLLAGETGLRPGNELGVRLF